MQQLCRRSLFYYYSIFEHHNLTCTGNSAHPVGDDEDGFIFLSAGIFKTPFLLSVTSLINRSRDAPADKTLCFFFLHFLRFLCIYFMVFMQKSQRSFPRPSVMLLSQISFGCSPV